MDKIDIKKMLAVYLQKTLYDLSRLPTPNSTYSIDTTIKECENIGKAVLEIRRACEAYNASIQ